MSCVGLSLMSMIPGAMADFVVLPVYSVAGLSLCVIGEREYRNPYLVRSKYKEKVPIAKKYIAPIR